MIKKAALFIVCLMLLGTVNVYAYDAPLKKFPDLSATDWSQPYVYTLATLGVVSGYTDKTFRPEKEVTREVFIQMLVSSAKLGKLSGAAPVTVKDVSKTKWSYSSIEIAIQRHLVDFMYSNGYIWPEKPISREEVAAMVGTYLLNSQTDEFKKEWLAGGWKKTQAAARFTDHGTINSKLSPYVYYAVNQNIMVGNNYKFLPKASLKRKEASSIIYKIIDRKVAPQQLDVTGFYAIKSANHLNKMDALSNVAFGWSNLIYNGAGSAQLSTSFPDGYEDVLQTADANGVHKSLMVFNNADDLADFLKDSQAQAGFIDSLLVTLTDEKYGFDGVCIDFEDLKAVESQPDFVQLLRTLKSRLNGKTLTVAVQPAYYIKGYDYKSIGEIADTVVLMAHDYTDKAARFPSAPLPLVNDTIVNALKLIPAQKLILGISKQANQWVTNSAGTNYYSPLSEAVESRLQQPGVSKVFSYPFFLSHITYKNGMDQNEIWYEDTASIEKKIWLAKYYGLKGVSLWYMGNYTEGDWQMVRRAAPPISRY